MNTLSKLVFTLLMIFVFNAQALMLNLKNTDIKTFINTVAMATGKNFLVDPRVKGVVNIIGNKEISDEELYNIFLTVLKAYGYVVIEGESISRIVPKNLTKAESAFVSSTANDAIITKVINMNNNLDGKTFIPLVRPLMSPHGLISFHDKSKNIIIIDTASNIKRLESIIFELDKPIDDDFEFITLKHALANNISTIIKTLMGDKAPAVTINKNTNQLIIGGTEREKLRVRLLVHELDKETAETGSTAIIYLKNASAKDILPILQNISNFTTSEKTEKGETVVKSNIQADEATNSIIVTGDNETKQMVKSIIEKLDVRRAQVLIEAIIAEVRTSDSERLGIEWIANENNLIGFSNLGGAIGASISAAGSGSGASALATALSGTGINVGAGNYNADSRQGFAAIISALSGAGNTNILSAPSVLTLDNQEAEIIVGEEVPFITNSQLTSDGNPFQNIEREDVGLKLTVTPQINNGDSIKLEIAQENSNVSASSAASDVITSKRSIKTTVIVEDGKILVLGGLMDDSIVTQKTKVPLLGDIPILGTLFSYDIESTEKRNLMVFIRPTILKDEILAEELSMEKYQTIKARQLLQNENFDIDKLLAE